MTPPADADHCPMLRVDVGSTLAPGSLQQTLAVLDGAVANAVIQRNQESIRFSQSRHDMPGTGFDLDLGPIETDFRMTVSSDVVRVTERSTEVSLGSTQASASIELKIVDAKGRLAFSKSETYEFPVDLTEVDRWIAEKRSTFAQAMPPLEPALRAFQVKVRDEERSGIAPYFEAEPEVVRVGDSGKETVTWTLRDCDGEHPLLDNRNVRFDLEALGTLRPSEGVTDADGKIETTYSYDPETSPRGEILAHYRFEDPLTGDHIGAGHQVPIDPKHHWLLVRHEQPGGLFVLIVAEHVGPLAGEWDFRNTRSLWLAADCGLATVLDKTGLDLVVTAAGTEGSWRASGDSLPADATITTLEDGHYEIVIPWPGKTAVTEVRGVIAAEKPAGFDQARREAQQLARGRSFADFNLTRCNDD